MEQSDPSQDLMWQWLDIFGNWLVQLGVPEVYRQQAALALLFVGATALVLVLAVWLLRRRSRPGRPAVPAEPEVGGEAIPSATEAAEPAREEPGEPLPVAEAGALPEIVPGPEQAPEEAAPEPAREELPRPAGEPTREGLFKRLRLGLAKTQASLVGRLDDLLRSSGGIQPDLLEDLEELLITADLGMKTTRQLVAAVEDRMSRNELRDGAAVRSLIRQEMINRLGSVDVSPRSAEQGPTVVMVVGVNGVGKTTTIGKLASRLTREGKKVVLGAGDTFRAAAAEQLTIWGERAGVDVIRHAEGADPGAVAFDAAKAAVARKADVLILDTAGRLHTKSNLMEELKKVRRVLAREIPGAPHETLLVLDATTGQNALVQAKLFSEAVEVTGLVMTKLDGTARGGIIIAIANDLGLPVRYIGIGESVEDLRPFEPAEFVAALFETD